MIPIKDTKEETPTDTLPTGAYVIRNKENSTVIHISRVDVAAGNSSIVAHKRDEIQYREQQIWWVERLPEDVPTASGEVVYSITTTGSGLSLDVDGAQTKQGAHVGAWSRHGGYNQKWRLPKESDTPNRERSIIGVASGRALALQDPKPDSGSPLYIWDHIPQNPKQCWEFLKPVVAVPAGWVEIVNVGTGNILSQTYLTSLPQLIRPQEQLNGGLSSRYRERWGTQWTIVLPSSHQPQQGDGSGTWIIINRLTGGRIRHTSHPYNAEHDISICAVMDQGFVKVWQGERYMLELDDDNVWTIRNQGDLCYLEETDVSIGKGKELACINKTYKRGESRKTWSFRKVVDH